MKKRIMILILLILPIFLLTSCKHITYITGEGEVKTKEVRLKKDSGLIIENILIAKEDRILPVLVNIVPDIDYKLEILTQESILEHIKYDESVGILTISGSQRENYVTDSIRINIYGCEFSNMTFNLCQVSLNASSQNVSVTLKKASSLTFNNLSVKSFACTLESSSTIKGNSLQGNEFNATLNKNSKLAIESIQMEDVSIQSDSSTVDIENIQTINAKANLSTNSIMNSSGNGKHLDITISSESKYYGKEFLNDSVTLFAMGKSEVQIYARKTINVIDSGAKSIEYYGDAIVTKTVLG